MSQVVLGESFEQCSDENNYLEEDLAEFLRSYRRSHGATLTMDENSFTCNEIKDYYHMPDTDSFFKILADIENTMRGQTKHCIHHSLKRGAWKKKGFRSCNENENGKEVDEAKTIPCISKNYVDTASLIYEKTSHCLGFSPRKFFHLFNHEGGFHLGIQSSTGVLCGAQVADVAIQDVHRFFNRKDEFLRKYISEDFRPKRNFNGSEEFTLDSFNGLFPGPECVDIKAMMGHPYSKAINTCEKISLPRGWARCFMYGAIYYLSKESSVQEELEEKGILSREGDPEREEIITVLASLSYNSGNTKTLVDLVYDFWKAKNSCGEENPCPLITYDKLLAQEEKITVFCKDGETTVEKKVGNLKEFLKECLPVRKASRRDEVSQYIEKMQESASVGDGIMTEILEEARISVIDVGLDSRGNLLFKCKESSFKKLSNNQWEQILTAQEIPFSKGFSEVIRRCYNDLGIHPEQNESEESANVRLREKRSGLADLFKKLKYDLKMEEIGECFDDSFRR